MNLNTIEELVEDIRCGKMVVLMDDEDRENEGDLIMAASMVRPEDINFMASKARGLICLTLTAQRCEQLGLSLMVDNNKAAHGTNFTLSIEAREGVTTGISAADRAHTTRVAVARDARPEDIVQPGHVFPLRAQPGGVLNRAGHTEAGCDLAQLAGLEPAAVIVEIMNDDGTMARRPDLEIFAEAHDLKIGTIADLIHYRSLNEKTVERVREERVNTEFGEFDLLAYQDLINDDVHLVLKKGDLTKVEAPVVRVHHADTLRDLIQTRQEKGGWNLSNAMEKIASEEAGVIVLLAHENESKNILQRLDSFVSSHKERFAPGKGHRTIGCGSQILKDLGVHKMRLLSSPVRFNALSGFDLEVVEYLPFDES